MQKCTTIQKQTQLQLNFKDRKAFYTLLNLQKKRKAKEKKMSHLTSIWAMVNRFLDILQNPQTEWPT